MLIAIQYSTGILSNVEIASGTQNGARHDLWEAMKKHIQ
jgi:hypothetical protein